jgi:hypothetical protein
MTKAVGFRRCSSTRKALEDLGHVSVACPHPKLLRQRKAEPDNSTRLALSALRRGEHEGVRKPTEVSSSASSCEQR